MNLATGWTSSTLDLTVSSPTSGQCSLQAAFPYRIAQAGLCHIDELLRLEKQLFHTDRCSRKSFYHLIRRCRIILLQPADSPEILGYATLLTRKNSTRMRIYSFGLTPEVRGRGLGDLLLCEIEQRAAACGYRLLTLEVAENNLAALGLYSRNGFRQCGFRMHYYEDGGHAILMRKTLSNISS